MGDVAAVVFATLLAVVLFVAGGVLVLLGFMARTWPAWVCVFALFLVGRYWGIL
jgi:hypothetical protein